MKSSIRIRDTKLLSMKDTHSVTVQESVCNAHRALIVVQSKKILHLTE